MNFRRRAEEYVLRTIQDEFNSSIPATVPDAYIDLQPRKDENKPVHAVLFTKDKKIIALDNENMEGTLARCKTIGLIDPYCQSKTFIGNTAKQVKDEIIEYSAGNSDVVTDSFIFESNGKYLGYTSMLLPHVKTQIATRFASYLQKGGAIVSIRDRILCLTKFATSQISVDVLDNNEVFLFCDVGDYAISVWIVLKCGIAHDNDIFCPIIQESDFSNGSTTHNFLITSVLAQSKKQYRIGHPSIGVFINGSRDDSVPVAPLLETLKETCDNRVIVIDENNAALLGTL